ncbi:hypothetical protein FB451DRAFT_1167916 [Mycena latifolia]|nr:hypothetical protein FB451DRAFT_1167916 [Mycena latifolia]
MGNKEPRIGDRVKVQRTGERLKMSTRAAQSPLLPQRPKSSQRQTQQPSVRARYAEELHRILTPSTVTKVELGISSEVIAIAKKEILNVIMDKTLACRSACKRPGAGTRHRGRENGGATPVGCISVHESQEIHTWVARGMVNERLHLIHACQSADSSATNLLSYIYSPLSVHREPGVPDAVSITEDVELGALHLDDQKPHQSGVTENSDACKGCPERYLTSKK